jgi:hypothetical protein
MLILTSYDQLRRERQGENESDMEGLAAYAGRDIVAGPCLLSREESVQTFLPHSAEDADEFMFYCTGKHHLAI